MGLAVGGLVLADEVLLLGVELGNSVLGESVELAGIGHAVPVGVDPEHHAVKLGALDNAVSVRITEGGELVEAVGIAAEVTEELGHAGDLASNGHAEERVGVLGHPLALVGDSVTGEVEGGGELAVELGRVGKPLVLGGRYLAGAVDVEDERIVVIVELAVVGVGPRAVSRDHGALDLRQNSVNHLVGNLGLDVDRVVGLALNSPARPVARGASGVPGGEVNLRKGHIDDGDDRGVVYVLEVRVSGVDPVHGSGISGSGESGGDCGSAEKSPAFLHSV